MDLEKMLIIFQANKGKIIGIITGLSLSLFIINFGIIKTFFVILCCFIGVLFGKIIDDGNSVQIWVKKNFIDS